VPLILLPKGIRTAVEADSSAERLRAFLLTPESGNVSLQISNTTHAPHQSPKGAGTKFSCFTGTKVKILTSRTALLEDEDSITSGERVPSASRRLDVSAKSGGGLCDASGKPSSRVEAKCEQQRGRIEMVKASFAYGKGT
jgi:hypothetical protein